MTNLSRRSLLEGAAAAAALGAAGPALAAGRRPNILFLFCDQLRAMSLSLYGESNIRTPVFDELLRSGTHFTKAYAADPVCAPSRASVLTGLYPTAHGVAENGDRLAVELPSMADKLGAAGYRTGYIGKWHLDNNEKPGFVPPKRRHGFRWWRAYNSGHHWRRSVFFADDDDTPRRPSPPDRFEPAYQVDHALEFMKGGGDKPWFLMMSFGPPHPPGTTPIADWAKDLPDGILDRVDADRLRFPPNVPEWIQKANRGKNGKGDADPGARHHMHGYYASILALEDEVGRLLEGLRGMGLAKDTLIVLSADHGEMGGSHGHYKKGQPYEEALRVPLGFTWPGVVGRRAIEAPVSGVDIAPTLIGLIDGPGMKKHGLDLTPTLLTGREPDRPSVLSSSNLGKRDQWFALRGPRYTYVEQGLGSDKRVILWDNTDDPGQEQNLASDKSVRGIRNRMAIRMKQERKRTRAAGPDPTDNDASSRKKK
ncbi:MAG: arylsulfatase A-like enzyme [Myxococcota bacterium]